MIKETRNNTENRDAAVDRESHRCQRRARADNHTAASAMPQWSIMVIQVNVTEFETLILHVTPAEEHSNQADLNKHC